MTLPRDIICQLCSHEYAVWSAEGCPLCQAVATGTAKWLERALFRTAGYRPSETAFPQAKHLYRAYWTPPTTERLRQFVTHALAAGSRRAKTAKPVECEASQSGPKGNAQESPQ